MLRQPVIDGWMGDESDTPATRGSWGLQKLPGGGALVQAAAAPGVVLSPAAVPALDGAAVTIMVGWPESCLVVRHAGVVVHGEGDVVHFGDLALDQQRVLRRLGFEYLHATGADVAVDMQLEERSSMDPQRALRRSGFDTTAERIGAQPVAAPRETHVLDTIRMLPGQSARFGPYELILDRAYDYTKRPIAGESSHGYFFRLRRLGEDVVAARASGYPDPLELTRAEPLLLAAREHGLLLPDEALASEPDRVADTLTRYEGARARLEQDLAAVGPSPPRLKRLGDSAVAVAARVARSADGAPVVGRVHVTLGPVGAPTVRREDLRTLPGRLRRAPAEAKR